MSLVTYAWLRGVAYSYSIWRLISPMSVAGGIIRIFTEIKYYQRSFAAIGVESENNTSIIC